jgi:hypothetical protein
LLGRTGHLVSDNRREVLALAHALESHKTLSGEDVEAVMTGQTGPVVDGRVYADPRFLPVIEQYHQAHVDAHLRQLPVGKSLPGIPDWMPEVAIRPNGPVASEWGAPAPTLGLVGDDGHRGYQPPA